MTKKEFSLTQLMRASKSLQEALAEKKTALIRDAVIQRFEYTYELAWKSMRRYFKLNNQIELENAKDIFREAGRQKLIESVERWFDYQRARNLTSHTYEESVAEEVYETAKLLSADVDYLINQWVKILGRKD